MGYAAEKYKAEQKRARVKRIVCFAVAVAIVAIVCFSLFVPPSTWQYYVALPKIGKRGEGEMRIHFVDVGQGDCTIVELPDGKLAVIDGGDGSAEANRAVLRYLHALGADEIDLMILTHADKDHMGGLTEVLAHEKVGRVFLPTIAEESADYDEFFAAVLKNGAAYTTACPPVTAETALSVADGEYPYTLAFLYPHSDEAGRGSFADENAASSVLWLDYRGVSALFTGDAPKATEERLLFDDQAGLLARYGVSLSSTEILKVAHHGGADSTGKAFAEYLGVDTAIVSCGADNDYGHPAAETVETLTGAGADVYRTDTQGSIVVTVTAKGERSVCALKE